MTSRMLEALINCHEQHVADPKQPCTFKISSSMGSLYTRKLVDVKAFWVGGKQIMGFYITQMGIELLDTVARQV